MEEPITSLDDDEYKYPIDLKHFGKLSIFRIHQEFDCHVTFDDAMKKITRKIPSWRMETEFGVIEEPETTETVDLFSHNDILLMKKICEYDWENEGAPTEEQKKEFRESYSGKLRLQYCSEDSPVYYSFLYDTKVFSEEKKALYRHKKRYKWLYERLHFLPYLNLVPMTYSVFREMVENDMTVPYHKVNKTLLKEIVMHDCHIDWIISNYGTIPYHIAETIFKHGLPNSIKRFDVYFDGKWPFEKYHIINFIIESLKKDTMITFDYFKTRIFDSDFDFINMHDFSKLYNFDKPEIDQFLLDMVSNAVDKIITEHYRMICYPKRLIREMADFGWVFNESTCHDAINSGDREIIEIILNSNPQIYIEHIYHYDGPLDINYMDWLYSLGMTNIYIYTLERAIKEKRYDIMGRIRDVNPPNWITSLHIESMEDIPMFRWIKQNSENYQRNIYYNASPELTEYIMRTERIDPTQSLGIGYIVDIVDLDPDCKIIDMWFKITGQMINFNIYAYKSNIVINFLAEKYGVKVYDDVLMKIDESEDDYRSTIEDLREKFLNRKNE